MRTPKRAAFRLALTGWLALTGLALAAASSRAAAPPEKVLPDSTVFFFEIKNAAALREAFKQSQFGQLAADPAVKAFKDDLVEKIDESGKSIKDKVGVSLRELLELPQGIISIAVVGKDNADDPADIILSVDAGKNTQTMHDVLVKATKQGEETGAKVAREDFKGLALTVIQPPKPKEVKEGQPPVPPIVWTHEGSQFTIGTDLDLVKNVLAHANGREDALGSTENFTQSLRKLGSDGQIVWYADFGKLIQLASKMAAKGKNAGNVEQIKAMVQVLGINGLKSAAGTFALNTGTYDSLNKIFVLAPVPVQGILKLFSMPKVNLRPEPWVPATVASYQTYSWDLDAAFVAINDLANMFQPGVLNVLEQQLVGPNGGEPLSLKKDIFDPIGDRISLVSDFKKPITEDSQRMLLGVALEDVQTFRRTLEKLIALGGGAPKKREFQGTTIYDFDVPALPNANPGQVQFKGPISLTIAKNTFFVASDPTLLELTLRGGGPALAESPSFQAVAKEIPEKVSSLSYARPDESARLSYDMIKSGQFEKALAGAAVAGGGPDISKLGKAIDKNKLPDFSVFAKYLSQGGGYSLMEDDGVTFTSFTLRKTNP